MKFIFAIQIITLIVDAYKFTSIVKRQQYYHQQINSNTGNSITTHLSATNNNNNNNNNNNSNDNNNNNNNNNNSENDVAGRRRKRNNVNKENDAFERKDRTLVDDLAATKTPPPATSTPTSPTQPKPMQPSFGSSNSTPPSSSSTTTIKSSNTNSNVINSDGTSSLEDLFGLGDSMLGDLMDDMNELPVPREDLITGKTVQEEDKDKNKVFQLPDLNEFWKEESIDDDKIDSNNNNSNSRSSSSSISTSGTAEGVRLREKMTAGGSKRSDRRKKVEDDNRVRVDRRNQEEYMRVMQLNPFADADETLFLDEYDIIPAIFGSGKLLNIPIPYLQTGHGMLLLVASLAAFVYAPGNPLTAFPIEIREFIKQSLFIVLSINVVLAVQAFFIAGSKNLPQIFWAMKTLLLGGVAFYEVNEAQDPASYKGKRD